MGSCHLWGLSFHFYVIRLFFCILSEVKYLLLFSLLCLYNTFRMSFMCHTVTIAVLNYDYYL